MNIKKFAFGVNFGKSSDSSEQWASLLRCLSPEDLKKSELVEFSNDGSSTEHPSTVCAVSGLKLSRGREISRKLSYRLDLISEVDWLIPFYQFNSLLSMENGHIAAKVDGDGMIQWLDPDKKDIRPCGEKPDRISPDREVLFVTGKHGKMNPEETARNLLRNISAKHSSAKVQCFPLEESFLPDILAFENGIRKKEFVNGEEKLMFGIDCEGNAYVDISGQDACSLELGFLKKHGAKNVFLECGASDKELVADRLSEEGLCCSVYDRASEHCRYLMEAFDFDAKLKWCSAVVLCATDPDFTELVKGKCKESGKDVFVLESEGTGEIEDLSTKIFQEDLK